MPVEGPSPAAEYRLRLLGSPALEQRSGRVSGRATRGRPLALLALLGSGGNRGLTRDKLTGLLWPDQPDATARHSLADTVYHLRKALGESAIRSEGELIRLAPAVVSADVPEFDAAIARDDPGTAIELYRGPFLDGFHLPGAPREFETWVDRERARLGLDYEKALEAVAETAESEADLVRAVDAWRRLMRHDPANSRVALRLMNTLAAAGDVANAIQFAGEHERYLREELDLEAPDALRELVRCLRREAAAGTSGADTAARQSTGGIAPGGAATVPERGGESKLEPVVPPATATATLDAHRARLFGWRVAIPTALMLMALIAVGILGTQWFAGRGSSDGPEVVQQLVAVLPFENRTGEPSLDALAEQVAERITTRLQQEAAGEVVPPSVVRSSVSGAPGEDPARSVAAATGAGLVITGFITGTADSIVLAVRFRDAATDRQIGSLDLPAATAELPDSALRVLVSRVSGGLLLAFSGEEAGSAFREFPLVEAYRLYREAAALQLDLRRGEALELHLAASRLDPTFSLPLGIAIGAAEDLGRYDTADSLYGEIAERFRPEMTEMERLEFDAARAQFDRDLEVAYRLQRRVLAEGPAESEAWGNMALYCFATNRPREALENVIEWGERLQDPGAREWQLWWLANAYHMLGEHERELETARIHEEHDWRPWRSMYIVARATAALGRVDEFQEIMDQVEGMADTTVLAGRVMLAAGLELRYHGYVESAAAALRRTVDWFERRPTSLADDRLHKLFHGIALYHAERWDEAAVVLDSPEFDEPAGPGLSVTGYRGLLAARQGDAAAADRFASDLERMGEEDRARRMATWAFRARIAAVLGRQDEAVLALRNAFDEFLLYWPGHLPVHQYRFDFEAMADYAPYQELLRPKG